ncbi:MAG: flagellar protein FlaG [Spirochaetales bacterium]|nr:MAG: flagellar protein FlaG [Spirochaetales bacterium]
MSMEITGIVGQNLSAARVKAETSTGQRKAVPPHPPVTAPRPEALGPQKSEIEISQIAEEMQLVADALNKRLKFSINRELGQVVVKVIDSQTDKVIKELPPEELQRMHVRIREAIGLLIDEAR